MGIPVYRHVKGYEWLYMVSDSGKVHSLKNGITLKPNKSKTGYLSVELFKNKQNKRCLIHRLVAEAFIENPNNYPQVNHKDEDKTNNCVENLEWCTPKHNMNYGTAKDRRVINKAWFYNSEEIKNTAILNGKRACRPVIQKDKSGTVLNRFESAKEAAYKLKVNASHIAETCLGKRKSAGNYVWEYERGNDLSACQ